MVNNKEGIQFEVTSYRKALFSIFCFIGDGMYNDLYLWALAYTYNKEKVTVFDASPKCNFRVDKGATTEKKNYKLL